MAQTSGERVEVAVRALNFVTMGRPVAGAQISKLGVSEALAITDAEGRAVIHAVPGEALTLVMTRSGFSPTQSATVTVPPGGLRGKDSELTFQTLPWWFYGVMLHWLRLSDDPSVRHVVTTVTARGLTLDDPVQGEPDAKVRLFDEGGREVVVQPIYLGIVPWVHKTDLFTARRRRLRVTSADGGVVIPNVPAGRYVIRAEHARVRFRDASVIVHKDSPIFVNASPPWGPRVID